MEQPRSKMGRVWSKRRLLARAREHDAGFCVTFGWGSGCCRYRRLNEFFLRRQRLINLGNRKLPRHQQNRSLGSSPQLLPNIPAVAGTPHRNSPSRVLDVSPHYPPTSLLSPKVTTGHRLIPRRFPRNDFATVQLEGTPFSGSFDIIFHPPQDTSPG